MMTDGPGCKVNSSRWIKLTSWIESNWTEWRWWTENCLVLIGIVYAGAFVPAILLRSQLYSITLIIMTNNLTLMQFIRNLLEYANCTSLSCSVSVRECAREIFIWHQHKCLCQQSFYCLEQQNVKGVGEL